MNNEELMHHGVKGMKWGVRRYQNKDGSLTALGKYKKYKATNQRHKNLEKAREAKVSKKKASQSTAQKKSVKEMSDAELQAAIRRLEMEQRYNQLSPKKISKGKAFVNRVSKNVVIPAAENIGRQLITSAMAKAVNEQVIPRIFDGDINDYKVYTNNKKK